MNLQERIDLLVKLGDYMAGDEPAWLAAHERAYHDNSWFIPVFVNLAADNIIHNFLSREALEKFTAKYSITEPASPKKVGLVPAGNIPLVGFHDILCIFLSGHYAWIKPSSKDEVLVRHITDWMKNEEPAAEPYFVLSDRLKNCDAYIATGSNNTSRYFEYYFGRYPHIIRKNRTSVAILTGKESATDLEKLADDICQYFGLGCRNVTRLYVPENYDFIPLLKALDKYDWMKDHNKFRNNYDHNLALHILNNKYYMTNGTVLVVEDPAIFAPVSQVNYSFYKQKSEAEQELQGNDDVQAVVGFDHLSFGKAQCPPIDTFADGVDTMVFLTALEGEKYLRRS